MPPVARLVAISSIALLLALLSAPSISFAHERRTIGGGKYDVVVGWDVEPAYLDQKNAASIRISKAGTNPAEPITGADKTLAVEIRQGAQTKRFTLRSVFGQPGYYVADIVPTREGDYQWTFSGSLGDDKITEKFDTADGKFHKVEPISGLQFPLTAPDPAQVSADIQAARAAAQSAQTMGMIGVALGVLAVLAAGALWLTRPRGGRVAVTDQRAAGERVA
jgi:antitoxin (DNA-binding transcriptional repressor) of toxin-antitoxin stability system